MLIYATLILSLIVLGNALGLSFINLVNTTWGVLEPVNNILEFIVKLPQWINYYNNLKNDADTLKEKTRRLTCKANDIRSDVSAAELRTRQQVKAEVSNWLDNVRAETDQVERILEQSNREMNVLLEFFHRAWLGIIHVDKKIQQVEQLLESGSSLQSAPLVSEVKSNCPFLTPNLIGVEATSKVNQVLELLESDRVSCIGIHGAQGTGKTATIKHVYNQLMDNPNVYYIQIRQNITNLDLTSMIARTLGLELAEEDESRWPDYLHRALNKKGKFVVIIDGLIKDFKAVDVGIPMHRNGGKLIFTTRSPTVCRRMDSQVTIELHPLSEDEADELFRKEAEISEYDSREMEGVARCIRQQCGNVPGTIVRIADMLKREHNINVWWDTLNELQKHL